MQYAAEHGGDLPAEDLEKLAAAQSSIQRRGSELYKQHPAYMRRLFNKNLKAAIGLAMELKAPQGSPSLVALCPTINSFKQYLCAMRLIQPPVQHRMREVQAALESFVKFGHMLDFDLIELALSIPRTDDRSIPITGEDALICGQILSWAIANDLKASGQCFYLVIKSACSGKELTTCAWAVQQLSDPAMTEFRPLHQGGIRSCLTEALLSMARAGRIDDAGTVLATARKYNVSIHAGALQAIIPNMAERLRSDLLVHALEAICSQSSRTAEQAVPIKMDEGTMLAILNAAAATAHAPLARMAWGVLVRSLAKPTSSATHSSNATSSSPPLSGEDHSPAPLPDLSTTTLPQPHKYMLTERTDAASRVYIGPMNVPCISAFHAVIHALGAAGELREAMVMVGQLCEAHFDSPNAHSWQSLKSFVTAISPSVHRVDAAEKAIRALHAENQTLHISMLNVIVAACSQVGDLARAFETYEAATALDLVPDVETYNALMWGCTRHGQNDSVEKLVREMALSGIESNAQTRELLVESAVVARDIPRMLQCLQEVEKHGQAPPVKLLTRCVERAERSGDVDALKILMARLDMQNYKIVGVAAKVRRWAEEGGMSVLVGGDSFVSRPMSGGYKHPDTVPALQGSHGE